MNGNNKYLALLRGVNVGGKFMVKMADLSVALTDAGFADVKTYIQSGNVIFSSQSSDEIDLARRVRAVIADHFYLDVDVVVLSCYEWADIMSNAPKWWGQRPDWKHNLLVMIPPYDMTQTMAAIGVLKTDIESAAAGDGVVYQSMSKELFGRTAAGKLSTSPMHKRMTVRNFNTATKLLQMMNS